MAIADWLPYPPQLYTNIGFGLSELMKFDCSFIKSIWLTFQWNSIPKLTLGAEGSYSVPKLLEHRSPRLENQEDFKIAEGSIG